MASTGVRSSAEFRFRIAENQDSVGRISSPTAKPPPRDDARENRIPFDAIIFSSLSSVSATGFCSLFQSNRFSD
jgi:hypothetical protein